MERFKKLAALAVTGVLLLCALPAGAADLVIAGRDGIYGKALESSVSQFKKIHPDLDIQLLKLPYGSLYEKLAISLQHTDSAYDVVMIDDTWAPEFMKNNWLSDLGQADPDFKGLDIAKYPVGSGTLFAIPFVGNVEMFAFRADLFKKHGLATPQSWTDVLEAAKTIYAEEPGVAGVVFRGTKGNPIVTGFLPILWAHGGSVIGTNGKSAVNSKAGLDALTLFLSLKDYAPEGVELYNASEVRDALQQGKAAMAIEVWPSWVPSMDDTAVSKVAGKMTIMAAPGQVKGPAPMLGMWQLAVTKGTGHKENARAFIDFVTSTKNQKRLALDLGLPPTRATVYTDADVVSKYRWYPAQLAALENGQARPRIKAWKKVESVMGDYLQLALVGQMPPKKALELMSRDINRALK